MRKELQNLLDSKNELVFQAKWKRKLRSVYTIIYDQLIWVKSNFKLAGIISYSLIISFKIAGSC